MILRCVIDGLLLPAEMAARSLVAWDGDESFTMEAVEALHYEMVAATPEELTQLARAHYRLLRVAADFELAT